MYQPFHLAFAVHDLDAARDFYCNVLGCVEGRSDERWVDFNMFGHQVVAHLDEAMQPQAVTNAVDGDAVPVPHFGVILTMSQWRAMAERLESAQVQFLLEPHLRFAGGAGEQMTLFIRDPSGNALEFKAFGDPERIFET